MKREGIFCDKKVDERFQNEELCPEIAIGKCISCDDDVCAKHGNPQAIALTLHRAVIGTSSQDLLANGAVTLCTACLNKLAGKRFLFNESIIPALLEHISEIVKAALVGEALR